MSQFKPSMESACEFCGKHFPKKTSNQIYCDGECTKLATNERVMERYYERKANRQGKSRVCGYNACDTKLSRYNDDDYCSIHETLRYDVSFMKEWAG